VLVPPAVAVALTLIGPALDPEPDGAVDPILGTDGNQFAQWLAEHPESQP
jgi:hypothetical protein